MFEVGFTEILLICAIALMVLGPARLPKLVADLGRWAGRARSMARQLRTQLEQETHFDPLKDIRSVMDAPSNTIHPAPTPPAAEVDAASRSTPAQAAESVAPPLGAQMDVPEVAVNSPPDAGASPDKTGADEPKHG